MNGFLGVRGVEERHERDTREPRGAWVFLVIIWMVQNCSCLSSEIKNDSCISVTSQLVPKEESHLLPTWTRKKNSLMFWRGAPLIIRALSQNIGKLLSKLKLLTDDLPLHKVYISGLSPDMYHSIAGWFVATQHSGCLWDQNCCERPYFRHAGGTI